MSGSTRDPYRSGGTHLRGSALLNDVEQRWDQGNSNAAIRQFLDGAGLSWAIPRTFRRTVATLLHEAGVPIVHITDRLGHSDPAMTARLYLGRDFEGDKSDLAIHLQHVRNGPSGPDIAPHFGPELH